MERRLDSMRSRKVRGGSGRDSCTLIEAEERNSFLGRVRLCRAACRTYAYQ